MIRLLALLLAACLFVPSTSAQTTRPDLTRFRAFADPMVGEWDVTIRDLDESGAVTWEGRQRRLFAYILADEFLEERALVHSPSLGRAVVARLHIASYDPDANHFMQQGFWPGSPGVLFDVSAELAADNRRADGTITMPRETGVRASRRIEIVWTGPDEFTYRVFARRSGASEFVNEELIYRRARGASPASP